MKTLRNQPCPCGSGKKYKKCCLSQDQKAAAEQNQQVRGNSTTDNSDYINNDSYTFIDDSLLEYCDTFVVISNQAVGLIDDKKWKEAEACCKQLLEEFPKEIDGHWRTYEYHQARKEYRQAKQHAQTLLEMLEEREGFDPSFQKDIQKDIETFTRHIEADDPSE